jgi:phage baseplate assembly protein V
METAFEIAELHRRLGNLLKIGRIEEVNYSGVIPLCRVRVGDLLTGWLPMLGSRAGPDNCWWPLEVDEQVVVLSPSGDPAQGVVLGAINQRRFAAQGDRHDVHRVVYADGAVIEYDRAAHHLKAVLPGGATTELVSDGGVAIVGDVTVTGHIKATGEITDHTRSMQADRDIFNSHTHRGVKSGGSSTAVPNQSQ